MRVLVRYYNKINLGDDLFVYILAERYSNAFQIVAASRLSFPRLANIHKVNFFWFNEIGSWIVGRFFGLRHLQYRLLSKQVDILIYIGGSIFIDQGDYRAWRAEVQFYQSLKIPYHIIGSNIGPVRSKEFISYVREIIAGSTDTCLRDKASLKLVEDLPNVRLAADVVFTLAPNHFHTAVAIKKTVVISVIDAHRRFNQGLARQYDACIARLAEKAVRDGYMVIFMSFCRKEGDERASRRILRLVNQDMAQEISCYNYRGNVEQAIGVIKGAEVIIGTRFHANILGFVFGKKVLPIAYSDKMIDVLKDMNFTGQMIDIRQITPGTFNDITFDTIPVIDITAQQALAQRQFCVLDKLLARRVNE